MSYQLNLIDEALLPVAVRPSLAALLVLALLCTLGGIAHLGWERSQLGRSLAQPGADSATIGDEPPADPVHASRLAQLQRDERLSDALAGFSDLPLDSAARLQQLAAALPDSLWLTEVELSGRRGVRIAGGALDTAALAAYASRLSQLPAFSGLPLQALSVEPRREESAATDALEVAAASRPAVAMHHHFVLTSGSMATDPGSTR